MIPIDTETLAAHQPELTVAQREATELVELRGTRRGKTHLSLGELEAKVEHYPEPARTLTRAAQSFFVANCGSDFERLRGLAAEKLELARSVEYFSNWIKGSYFRGGTGNVRGQGLSDWTAFCEALKELDRLKESTGKLGVIETSTTRAIENHVREIMDVTAPCRFAGISGPTGSQKTESLRLVCLKMGFPRAVRFECNTGMNLGGFQRKWANCYNAKVGNSRSAREESLAMALNPDRLVIIHNIQRCLDGSNGLNPVFEYLIEVQEEKRFALVLEFKEDFMREQDRNAAYFEQVIGRFGGYANILRLPQYTPLRDLRAIAQAYNLHDGEEAMNYLKAWSKQPGRIRIVFARLHRAKRFAKADGKDRITLDLLRDVNEYVPPASVGDNDGGES